MNELVSTPELDAIVANLNDRQLEAVTAEPGHQLVLAGAGSGKTRVLVHRLAYLVHHYGVHPYETLAVTFTNKAAREMLGRIGRILNIDTNHMWIGTFHGLANRILRRHTKEAGLPRDYEILSAQEQRQVVKLILEEKKINSKVITPESVAQFINSAKDKGRRAHEISLQRTQRVRMVELYSIYDNYCRKHGLVDFAELLLRCNELWLENEPLLEQYRQRFTEILVDEFQDTNAIQYAWIRNLAGNTGNVMVVGDDDQSIYGWRGAEITNIMQFADSFKANTIKLEENYRSAGNILKAANNVIKKNAGRLGKTLWTQASDGARIVEHACHDEHHESRSVVELLQRWLDEQTDHTYDDIVILYRSNYQSRLMEQELSQAEIPYSVRGGIRFFERSEIKDALAFMRLVESRHADVAFDRVLNVPARGLGSKSRQAIRALATNEGKSLWDAAVGGLEYGRLPKRAANGVRNFITSVETLASKCEGRTLSEIAHYCVHDSGLLDHLRRSEATNPAQVRNREENLEELIRACQDAEQDTERSQDNDASLLVRFLDAASLDTGDSEAADEPSVNLMTVHSAKGLEFPLVFMIGMEEGSFPSSWVAEEDTMEEERRLLYVGMTRAMKQLHMTHAVMRQRRHGGFERMQRSRFLDEIPDEYIERPLLLRHRVSGNSASRQGGQTPDSSRPESSSGNNQRYHAGDRVNHELFGLGRVRDVQGTGSRERVLVGFDDGSQKLLISTATALAKV